MKTRISSHSHKPRRMRFLAGALALASVLAATPLSAGNGRLAVADGVEIHYQQAGRGSAVIFVHGGFMDAEMWDKQFREFARSHRAVRFDLRGFGKSDRGEKPFQPTEDIAALLDHLKIERAHIVGLSMGGSVAIDFALAHPERTASLVVAEPGVSGYAWGPEVLDTMRAVRQAFENGGKEAAIESLLSRPVFATLKDKPAASKEVRRQLERNLSDSPPLMEPPEKPALDRLSEIRSPTLLLVSEHSGEDAHKIASLLQEKVDGLRRMRIPDSGHMINLEQPDAFNQVVLDFLASI